MLTSLLTPALWISRLRSFFIISGSVASCVPSTNVTPQTWRPREAMERVEMLNAQGGAAYVAFIKLLPYRYLGSYGITLPPRENDNII